MLAKILPWVGGFVILMVVNCDYLGGSSLTQFHKPENYDNFDVLLFRRSNDTKLPPVILRPYVECLKGSLHAFQADSSGFPKSLPISIKDFTLRPPAWPDKHSHLRYRWSDDFCTTCEFTRCF